MISKKAKKILDIIVAICSIVSCITAVYGVFQVVDFVVDVKPIVVPIAKEVKEGNVDVRSFISGSAAIRRDTVKVIEHDTVYLGQGEAPKTKKDALRQQMVTNHRLTAEDEQRFDHSADYISEEDRQGIDNQESNFRQRMKNKMKTIQNKN